MPHDFKKFPELTNSQMQLYYFESPHRQILEDFNARVVKVIDGDTIRVRWSERDFDFPVRLWNIDAPEIKTAEGLKSRNWLQSRILNKEVSIIVNSTNRVGKWGRILGDVMIDGDSMSAASLREGRAEVFA